MPVMHPVVAGDHLTRLCARENAALETLESGIRRPSTHHGGAKLAAGFNRLIGGFMPEACGVRGHHGALPKIRCAIVDTTRGEFNQTVKIFEDSTSLSVNRFGEVDLIFCTEESPMPVISRKKIEKDIEPSNLDYSILFSF